MGSKFRSSIDNTHHSSWQSATLHQGSIIAATTPPSPRSDRFSESFEELINDQGEIVPVVDFDPQQDSVSISSYAILPTHSPDLSSSIFTSLYLSASQISPAQFILQTDSSPCIVSDHDIHEILLHAKTRSRNIKVASPIPIYSPKGLPEIFAESIVTRKGVSTKKKYKPVVLKVHPVAAELPARFRIVQNITGNPLADMPLLEPIIPPFIATGRYTQERRDALDKNHQDFLWPQERDLMHNFMCKQHLAFAWDDSERGRFHSNFFPDIEIPV